MTVTLLLNDLSYNQREIIIIKRLLKPKLGTLAGYKLYFLITLAQAFIIQLNLHGKHYSLFLGHVTVIF